MTDEIRLGDVIRTRKPHPCGGDTWTVIRVGADIKIRCHTCGRIVMLERDVFLKRRKALLEQGKEPVNGTAVKENENDVSNDFC
ncbi:MAG: DUF951 domain-containing protein [Clostridiales bacterium]|nr:DUF951 domain-containing protein [Clostridiales bacterium]